MQRAAGQGELVGSTLDELAAARYVGFTSQAFNVWGRRGLLPPADRGTGGWTKAALDEAIERLQHEGVQHDRPRRRHSRFIKIYHAHRVWKNLETGDGHWFFRFRPTGEPLPGDWGSPAFMTVLIDCERRYATQHRELAANPSETPQATEVEKHSPAAAQPSPAAAARSSELATWPELADRAQQRPAHGQTASPPLAPSIAGVREAVPDYAADKAPATRPKTTEEFLTEQEIVTRYRGLVSEGTLRNWRHQKIGPPYLSIARKILYPRAALLQWEKQQLYPKL